MSDIKYLIDENQRGMLWRIIQRHNARGIYAFHAQRVGDPPDLPLKSKDHAIIQWCAENEHILVTFDKTTMPDQFRQWLSQGRDHPGLFVLRRDDIPQEVVEFLYTAAHASLPSEWRNRIQFIP